VLRFHAVLDLKPQPFLIGFVSADDREKPFKHHYLNLAFFSALLHEHALRARGKALTASIKACPNRGAINLDTLATSAGVSFSCKPAAMLET
jgi:hypothetical protein